MEQHGNNHHNLIVVIIPARFASTRLPGKLLLDVAGVPLVIHTLRQASKARLADRVIVATDDTRILTAVTENDGEAVMTSSEHPTGSDRIAEVALGLPANSIIVNVQGDEPLISPNTIDIAVQAMLDDPECDIVTTCEAISDVNDVLSPDVVKVVSDPNGRALYFSRSPIPFPRDAAKMAGSIDAALAGDPELLRTYKRHTGIYVYRREYLLQLCKLPQTSLERFEMLEQLRALENGAKIRVVETGETSIGVDNAADLERVRGMIGSNG
ncbi:MAG: 3-deoxy-manno-octulosonate cytidylyltransferase [Pyrinomonadaceae bacterium]|nr:3-deoxy-manno-octulosonate cytidylyltransferase [Pyrinomonadaceae bacterium]